MFFQLVNVRYEKRAMILTSNRGFADWGGVFGDPVVAAALLDLTQTSFRKAPAQIPLSPHRARKSDAADRPNRRPIAPLADPHPGQLGNFRRPYRRKVPAR